jgi:glycosyltransferase involved in cell wall biosynthesis
MRRTVLVIAYEYPPRGWSGTQRTAKFCRYLPEFGWRPVVLAPRRWYLPAPMDETLLEEVAHVPTERTDMLTHEDIVGAFETAGALLGPVLRALGRGPNWLADGLRWRYQRFLLPDYACGWIAPAVRRGLALVRRYRPEVIYATGPPHSDLVIGAILSALTGRPLVADFRDLWVDYPGGGVRHTLREWSGRKLERWVCGRADRVVNVTEGNSALLAAKYPHQPPERFVTIRNGWDAGDFPSTPPPRTTKERMTIAYVGSLYYRQTPQWWLRALERAAEADPALRQAVRMRFVGDVGEYEPMLKESSCADRIERVGPVPHRQAVEAMLAADVLLLLIGVGGKDVMTGKIYEYLATRRPILAMVPAGGEAAGLLAAAAATRVVDSTDVDGAVAALRSLHEQWRRGQLPEGDVEFAARFERRQLTGQLAEVLDGCVRRAAGR